MIKIIENNPLLETLKIQLYFSEKESNNYFIRLGKAISNLRMIKEVSLLPPMFLPVKSFNKLMFAFDNVNNDNITEFEGQSESLNYLSCLQQFYQLTDLSIDSSVKTEFKKEVILKFNCLQLLNITLTNIQLTLNDVNCFLLKCTNLVNLSLKKPECSIYCIYPLVKNLNKFTTIRTFIIQDIIISSFQFFDFSEDFIKSFLYSFSKCFFIEIFRVSKNSPIINLDRKKYKVNNEFPLCFCLKEFQFFDFTINSFSSSK